MGVATDLDDLKPDVKVITTALQRLPSLPSKARAVLEACRIFRIFSMKAFKAALADAAQDQADLFAEALDAAAGFFSKQQQESITAPPAESGTFAAAEAETEEADAQVTEQLSALQAEVKGKAPASRRKTQAVKQELGEGTDHGGYQERPDLTGRAAKHASNRSPGQTTWFATGLFTSSLELRSSAVWCWLLGWQAWQRQRQSPAAWSLNGHSLIG